MECFMHLPFGPDCHSAAALLQMLADVMPTICDAKEAPLACQRGAEGGRKGSAKPAYWCIQRFLSLSAAGRRA